MLTIYKSTLEGLNIFENTANGCWIKAMEPDGEEIVQLERWGIESELITYSLDQDELARVERDDGYILILLRIPHFQGKTHDIPYTTIPLGIILKDNLIATICSHESHIIKILTDGRYRGFKTAKRYRFVLYILLETAMHYLTYLREINRAVDQVEDQLEKSTRNRELLQLLKFKKALFISPQPYTPMNLLWNVCNECVYSTSMKKMKNCSKMFELKINRLFKRQTFRLKYSAPQWIHLPRSSPTISMRS